MTTATRVSAAGLGDSLIADRCTGIFRQGRVRVPVDPAEAEPLHHGEHSVDLRGRQPPFPCRQPVVARDDGGGVSRPQRIDLPIRIPNERILETADGRAAYPLQLEMKPGPQKISVGVRDQLARVDSTLSLTLDVGASSAAPLPPEAWIWRRSDSGSEPAVTVAAR